MREEAEEKIRLHYMCIDVASFELYHICPLHTFQIVNISLHAEKVDKGLCSVLPNGRSAHRLQIKPPVGLEFEAEIGHNVDGPNKGNFTFPLLHYLLWETSIDVRPQTNFTRKMKL